MKQYKRRALESLYGIIQFIVNTFLVSLFYLFFTLLFVISVLLILVDYVNKTIKEICEKY